MGTFTVPLEVGNQATGEFLPVVALVDTGATYTLLPAGMLAQLAIKSVGKRTFELADQRTTQYDVGEVRMRLNDDESTVLVVFAPEGTPPLLGATVLELFSLGADPVNQRLIPVPSLLKQHFG